MKVVILLQRRFKAGHLLLITLCVGGTSGILTVNKVSGDVIGKSSVGDPMGRAAPVVTTLADAKQYPLVF
jgi:hypothetical protein